MNISQTPVVAATSPNAPSLRRVLGRTFGLAIAVGAMIGGGILRTPGSVAASLPNKALFMTAWALGGVSTLMGAVIWAELGAMMPAAGGPYVYTRRAMGRGMGFFVGYADWINFCLGYAFLVLLASEYLGSLIPALFGHVRLVAFAMLGLFAIMQWSGVKSAGWIQEFTSALKAAALIGLVVAAFVVPHTGTPTPGNASLATPHGMALLVAFGIAMQGIFFTYDSYYTLVYCAEEIRDPGREIPRSIFSGVILVTALYLLINAAFLAVLPLGAMANDSFVAGSVAGALFGIQGKTIITLIMIISLLGAINAGVMAAPRIILAMARNGLFPLQAARVNAGGTPTIALCLSLGFMALFVVSGTSDQVLAADILLALSIYVITFTSFFVLRRREPGADRPYMAWGYPVVPAIALATTIAIATAMTFSDHKSAVIVATLLALSLPVSWGIRRITGGS